MALLEGDQEVLPRGSPGDPTGTARCNIHIANAKSSSAPDPDRDTRRETPIPGGNFATASGCIDCTRRLITQSMMSMKTRLALAVVCLTIPLAASNVAMRPSIEQAAAPAPPRH